MKIWAIAVNTFREAIRDRILYNLLFFAVAIMALSITIGNLTLGQRVKIVQDIGLASMSVFGLLMAIFVGIQLVYKEIQRRTIYILLGKPVSRYQFILGKYLGLVLTIFINLAIMSAVMFFILAIFTEYRYEQILVNGVLLIFVELAIVTAVALFFSTFSTPALSAMFTLGVYIIGHLSYDLLVFARGSRVEGLKEVATVLYYLLPNLENFNIKTEVVYNLPVSSGFMIYSLAYGTAYLALILLASVIVFQKRDFK